MSRERKKGTAFESAVVGYMQRCLGCDEDAISRTSLHGKRDVGDVRGLRVAGLKVAVECKSCSTQELPRWLREAELERGNADADAAVVIHKRRGVGTQTVESMGNQLVTMRLHDLMVLAAGSRQGLEE